MVRVNMPGPLPTVWLNGLCPLEQANVHVLDRGFLFGDGIYELLPVYSGVAFRLEQHLARLARSLDQVGIRNPHDDDGWRELISSLVRANGEDSVTVYIQVSRGAATHRDHAFPSKSVEPTVFAMCAPLPELPGRLLSDGVSVILEADSRWARCDIKATSLLANVLLRQQATTSGAAEALLFDGDFITEGAASSVLAVIGGRIVTPPDGDHILPGTTRDLVMELAAEAGMDVGFQPISVQQLKEADEVWVSSSVRAVLPVTSIDGQPVGSGRPGPVWKQTYQLFEDYRRRVVEQSA